MIQFRKILQILVRRFEAFLISSQNKKVLDYLIKENLFFNNVIDIGGHHGELYTAMKRYNIPFISYHIFEPFEESFDQINLIDDQSLIKYNIGVSNSKGESKLKISNWETSNSLSENIDVESKRNKLKKTLYKEEQYVVTQNIKIDTLDNLFTNSELENIFLKVDVEGHELEVIQGAIKLLSSYKIKYLLVEIQDNNTIIKEKLQELGFDLKKIFKFPVLNISDYLFEKVK